MCEGVKPSFTPIRRGLRGSDIKQNMSGDLFYIYTGAYLNLFLVKILIFRGKSAKNRQN